MIRHHNGDMDDLTEEKYYSVVTALVSVITDSAIPVIQHDYAELMATSGWHRFHDVVRMEKQAFLQLLDILRTDAKLEGNEHVDAGEKLMILIHALVGFSNRQLTERWQHSDLTTSLYIYETITTMLQCKRFFFLT